MSGPEDVPERCAEICVFEIYGAAVDPGRLAAVGVAPKAFRDPAVAQGAAGRSPGWCRRVA